MSVKEKGARGRSALRTLRSSKRSYTPGSTSSELSQRVNTLASRSPSASKSSMTGRSFSSRGSRPGHVLKRLATKARLSLALPATSDAGVKYLRQPMASAF